MGVVARQPADLTLPGQPGFALTQRWTSPAYPRRPGQRLRQVGGGGEVRAGEVRTGPRVLEHSHHGVPSSPLRPVSAHPPPESNTPPLNASGALHAFQASGH